MEGGTWKQQRACHAHTHTRRDRTDACAWRTLCRRGRPDKTRARVGVGRSTHTVNTTHDSTTWGKRRGEGRVEGEVGVPDGQLFAWW